MPLISAVCSLQLQKSLKVGVGMITVLKFTYKSVFSPYFRNGRS